MEGTLAEIRLFAGNFTPRNWRLCDGSLLQINMNGALFALVGNRYGGDGRETFALPKLPPPAAVPQNKIQYFICVVGSYPARS